MGKDNIKTVLEFVGRVFAINMLKAVDRDSLDEFEGMVRELFECITEEHDLRAHLLSHNNTVPQYQVLRPQSQRMFDNLKERVNKEGWK